jgi:hypothetical protein
MAQRRSSHASQRSGVRILTVASDRHARTDHPGRNAVEIIDQNFHWHAPDVRGLSQDLVLETSQSSVVASAYGQIRPEQQSGRRAAQASSSTYSRVHHPNTNTMARLG